MVKNKRTNRNNYSKSMSKMLRKRSPPRVISLGGNIGTDTPMKGTMEIRSKRVQIPIGRKFGVPRPRMQASVKVRPEPSTSLPPSQYTSVSLSNNLPSINVPRIDISTKSNLVANRADLISSRINNNLATSVSPKMVQSKFKLKQSSNKLTQEGLILLAGQTHVWKLTERGVPKKPSLNKHRPSIEIKGDQAVRISFMKAAGGLLQDVELKATSQPIRISVPPGTRNVAVTGLGGAGVIPDEIIPATGAVTTNYSTHNKTSVGFQPHTNVTQIGPQTYLCRGGSLTTSSTNKGLASKKGTSSFPAFSAVKNQRKVKFSFPNNVTTLVVIISGDGDLQNTLNLELDWTQSTTPPQVIEENGMLAHIWEINAPQGETITLASATVNIAQGWGVHSMIASQGSAEKWVEALHQGSWKNLVENGPLTQKGRANLLWRDADEPLISTSTDFPTSIPRTKIEPESSKKSEKKNQPELSKAQIGKTIGLPSFDCPMATEGEPYTYSLSKLAHDEDEGDILTFSKISGDEWIEITPQGFIQGTPTKSEQGVVEAVVRVIDSEGAHADAVFIIPVKDAKPANRAPYWGVEATREDSGGD